MTIWQDNALRFSTRPEAAIDAIWNNAVHRAIAHYKAGNPGKAEYVLTRAGISISRIAGERRAS